MEDYEPQAKVLFLILAGQFKNWEGFCPAQGRCRCSILQPTPVTVGRSTVPLFMGSFVGFDDGPMYLMNAIPSQMIDFMAMFQPKSNSGKKGTNFLKIS